MNNKKKGKPLSGGVIVSLIFGIGLLFFVGLWGDGNGEGHMDMLDPAMAREVEEFDTRLTELEADIKRRLPNLDGRWSVYVMDLTHDLDICVNSEPMYAASLIKLYVMESTYAHMDEILNNARAYYGEEQGAQWLTTLMENMITLSDNESYNELVRLHSPNHSFVEGALAVNAYVKQQGYKDTAVYHTLHPAPSMSETASDNPNDHNMTSARDCGRLLERIYKGECVSKSASEHMENLLFHQDHVSKIPAGNSHADKIGNKTGETDTDQHDVAIIFGKDFDYILCIMTENLRCTSEAAMFNVEGMSRVVDKAMNGEAEPWKD